MARPRLKAVGMAERFPSGPSTARNPPGVWCYTTLSNAISVSPLSPRKQRVSPDRPGAVQGAKRRSEPLTAKTDLKSSGTRGKGAPATRAFSAPSGGAVPSPSRRDK